MQWVLYFGITMHIVDLSIPLSVIVIYTRPLCFLIKIYLYITIINNNIDDSTTGK